MSCTLPTGPSEISETGVEQTEWDIAISALADRDVPMWKLATLDWTEFRYKQHDGMFYCGDILTAGCYDYTLGLIEWTVTESYVLRHEMGHAILHRLGYKCWRDYQHPGTDSCPVVPTYQ